MMDNFGTLHIYIYNLYKLYIYLYIYIDKGYISLDMRRGYTYIWSGTLQAMLLWDGKYIYNIYLSIYI